MAIKDLFKDLLARTVFPAVDGLVGKWKTPFELDNVLWGLVKDKIAGTMKVVDLELSPTYQLGGETVMDLNVTAAPGASFFGAFPTITGKDFKDLFVRFVHDFLFKEVDKFTKAWTTPFELDDVAWNFLKGEIDKLIAQYVITAEDGVLAVAHVCKTDCVHEDDDAA